MSISILKNLFSLDDNLEEELKFDEEDIIISSKEKRIFLEIMIVAPISLMVIEYTNDILIISEQIRINRFNPDDIFNMTEMELILKYGRSITDENISHLVSDIDDKFSPEWFNLLFEEIQKCQI